MRRLELQDLLPPSAITHQTRTELLQQTALTSAGPAASTIVGGGTGGNTSTAEALGGLLQAPVKDITAQISALTAQVTGLNSTEQTQVSATQDNTQAVSQNTTAKASGGTSAATTAGSLVSNLLGGGLSPIFSSLMSLFGGGSTRTTTTPLTPFRLPATVQYQAGLSTGPAGAAVQPVDYGQTGQVRPTPASTTSHVNIQVNAMDSRSFLDHSEEIAQAVKAAMLSSNSLNDVIADL